MDRRSIGRVARVGCTPIKGCQHTSSDELVLDEDGPRGDRAWCLVPPEGGRVLRTIDQPRLVGVRARWDGHALDVVLPGGAAATGAPEQAGASLAVDYWGRTIDAVPYDGPHARLLSDFLGRPVRLARVAPGAAVYGAPVSLVSTASVVDAATRAGRPDLADQPERYRATVVVEADEPYIEDQWVGHDVAIGDAVVRVHGRMGRCGVVNLAPSTGDADASLLRSLADHRPQNSRGEPLLAVDATVVAPGSVRWGDTLQLHNDSRRTAG
ncbi:MOSC domain-containing protein [Nocardioides panacisoli]|uniref:MOSC domain-containing protein n=1 Tax=Nocardioides panacisoli TaxID=627624 RepID=UPI001C62AB5D|nr:MOSC N-terminal beta barrel domain-containing protein [Nocardioides panacisoli]QYJ03030.1 MOSC domain-containing protein [Nocardioides panacisoli]